MWRGQFALKFFAQNIWKESVTRYLCYFHKVSVQDHLHEYLRTVLCCFRLCLCGFNFFFMIKHEPLVGKTLIEIESAVAKQTKKYNFVFTKQSASDNFLPQSKGYLKTHFEFSFGINIKLIYSNSP